PALPHGRCVQGRDIEFDAGRREIDPQPMYDPAPFCRGLKDLAAVDDTCEYFGVRRCRTMAPVRLAGPNGGGQQERDPPSDARDPSPTRSLTHSLTALKRESSGMPGMPEMWRICNVGRKPMMLQRSRHAIRV